MSRRLPVLLLFPCCRLRGHRGGAQGQAGLAGTLRGLAPRASAPQRGGRRLPLRPGWRPHSLCGPRPGVPGGTREACGAEATLPPRPLGPSVAPTRARGSRGLMGDTWGLMCILCLQGLGPVWVWSPDPDRPQTGPPHAAPDGLWGAQTPPHRAPLHPAARPGLRRHWKPSQALCREGSGRL